MSLWSGLWPVLLVAVYAVWRLVCAVRLVRRVEAPERARLRAELKEIKEIEAALIQLRAERRG